MFWRMLRADLRRAVGWTFVLAVALTFLVQAQGLGEYLVWLLRGWREDMSVFFYLHFSLNAGTFQLFMPSVGALVFSSAYLRDRQSGYLNSLLVHTGRARGYLLARALCVYLSALSAVTLGVLLEAGRPFLYLLCTALIKAAGAASWALFALMLSAFTRSAFAVYVLPTLACYAANLVMKRLGLRSFSAIENGIRRYGAAGEDLVRCLGPLLLFSAVWTALAMMAAIIHLYGSPVRALCASYGVSAPPLPLFVGLVGTHSPQSLLYMVWIYWVCDAPFIDQAHLYVLMRSGRRSYARGMLLYLLLSSLLFWLTVFGLSVLLMAGRLEWSAQWAQAYITLARLRVAGVNLTYLTTVQRELTSAQAALLGYFLQVCCSFFLAALVMAGLISRRVACGRRK